MKKLFLSLLSLFVSSFSQAATPNGQDPLLMLASVAADVAAASSFLALARSADEESEQVALQKKGSTAAVTGFSDIIPSSEPNPPNATGGTRKYARKHVCTECGLTLPWPAALIIHMRTHTGERPFTCSTCKKAFANNSNLNAHIKTHTGKRPFKCTKCDLAFAKNSNLQSHVRVHTDKQLLQCGICLMSFNQRSHLTKHNQSARHLATCPDCHGEGMRGTAHNCIRPDQEKEHAVDDEDTVFVS